MKQLVLNLCAEQAQTFEHFVVGQNAELVHRLHAIASGEAVDAIQDHFVYMWGGSAAGKSHLLHAVQSATQPGCSRFITVKSGLDAFEYSPQIAYYLLDDCDRLSAPAQIAAFNLFNQIREQGGYLISTGALPPAQLALREDLRTRLGWGLIYQIVELTDEEKIAALSQIADTRGMTLPQGILPYLLTHYRRDMPSLSYFLDDLDRYSLETKRPVTMHLVRDLLQQQALNNS